MTLHSMAFGTSPYGISAVFWHQMPDGTEKPIAFASQSLSEAEKKYPQIEKEGLACVLGLRSSTPTCMAMHSLR